VSPRQPEVDGEVARRAERRHGLVTRADLADTGVDDDRIARWVASGRLRPAARGVYRLGGVPPTTEGRILAQVLVHGPGTWASHRTAAWLWDLPGFGPPGRVELVRELTRSNRREGATVHRATTLPPDHRAMRRSIPVTSLPRTLFDLAGCTGPGPLDRTVEVALRTSHCTVGALFRVVEELGGRGRVGSAAMRDVLDRRGRDYVPTESELDLLGRSVLSAIPGIDWQVPLSDERGYIRRVDGLHRSAGLVLEWDGAEFHDRAHQRRLDESGDRRLEALGLRVVRYRWPDVTQRPGHVRSEVAALTRTDRRSAA
jgi:hypothetical protein